MEQPEYYRKLPVTVQAIEWTGSNLLQVQSFIEGRDIKNDFTYTFIKDTWDKYEDTVRSHGLTIKTLEGRMMADIGDFIIKGVKGEFYPCKPDIFSKTYVKRVI